MFSVFLFSRSSAKLLTLHLIHSGYLLLLIICRCINSYGTNIAHIIHTSCNLSSTLCILAMTSVDEDADNLVMVASQDLIDEQPKIGTAVKNLIAMVIGKSISDPAKKLLFGGDYIFTPEIGLACGQCLLQVIQK